MGAAFMVAPQTILVIDDDPDIRDDIQSLLENQGYRVVTAPDGQVGLQRALTDKPDLIVVDMMMPKVSGFVVVERLRQAQQMVPIIMLTANESVHQRTWAEFLGVDAYLKKPVRFRQLLDHMRRLCPPAGETAIPTATAV
jgi:DNA-binding response OmpR family regulator